MGYKKIITYILKSESGVSLKAAGWVLENDCCGGGSWDVPSRPRNLVNPEMNLFFNERTKYPTEKKQRWVKDL